jgi:hypothetical protein
MRENWGIYERERNIGRVQCLTCPIGYTNIISVLKMLSYEVSFGSGGSLWVSASTDGVREGLQ